MTPVVVYNSDGRNYRQIEMSAFSVYKYLGPETRIFVLTNCGVKPDVPGVSIIDPVPILLEAGIFSDGWNRKWPFATTYRLAIPLIEEFKSFERILYLDTDTLVRSFDALRLFTMPVGDYEIYGAHDCLARQTRIDDVIDNDLCVEARESLSRKLWDVRATRTHSYINAGVSLWCMDNIRKNGEDWYRQRLKWFWEAETRGKVRFIDQDFLNIMMDTNPCLSERYNKFGGTVDDNCVIQHFVSKTKGEMEPTARAIGFGKTRNKLDMMPPIVYASNGEDYDRLKMSVFSLRKLLGQDTPVYLLTDSDKSPDIENCITINPVSLLKDVGLSADGWNRKWPFAAIFRIAIPFIPEFQKADRILYLDTDTIVKSFDVMSLFSMSMGDYEIYGVRDVISKDLESMMKHDVDPDAGFELSTRLWRPRATGTHAYINSGVLLWNVQQTIKNGIDWYKKRVCWFWSGIQKGKFHHIDQDFFNLMMDTNPCLSERYNRIGGWPQDECSIQHFVGRSREALAPTAELLGYRKL